jgi:xylan 1,4-beta-xylosidase
MITNYARPRHPIKTELVTIQLNQISNILSSFIERIDEMHANARKEWVEMGKPDSLSKDQVSALELASSLVKEPLQVETKGDSALLKITMPPQGTACVTLETA